MSSSTTKSIRPGQLSEVNYQNLQRSIESIVIDHAELTDLRDEADKAFRVAAVSSAALHICGDLQKAAIHNARRVGRSWSELGNLMAITRQAAQQRFTPLTPKEWFVTEWMAVFEQHEIRVRNSWTGGISIFVDGHQVAENRKLVSLNKESAVLSAWVAREKAEPFLVEVFAYALITVRVRITADGKQIAGEVF